MRLLELSLLVQIVLYRLRDVHNALTRENNLGGFPEDLSVEGKRAVTNVPDVIREPGVPVQSVATVNLGPTCDAWTYPMTNSLFIRVVWQIPRQERTGPDETHIAP